MPETGQPSPTTLSEDSSEAQDLKDEGSEPEKEPEQIKRELLDSPEDIEKYRKWKREVPDEFRKMVERKILNQPYKVDEQFTPLVKNYFQAFNRLLENPGADLEQIVNQLDLDPKVENLLEGLQRIEVNEDEIVNLFKLLADPNIDFDIKQNYFDSKVSSRLNYLQRQDRQNLQEYQQQERDVDIEDTEEPDEYEPRREPTQEMEGMPPNALALVYPPYGGYYKDGRFDHFDTDNLTWQKEKREYNPLPNQEIDQEQKRIYKASVSSEQAGVIKLPYGWGVDQDSITFTDQEPQDYNFAYDQDGSILLQVDSETPNSFPFELEIGPTSDQMELEPPKDNNQETLAFPDELKEKMQQLQDQNISDVTKARKISSFIRSHLEYDQDFEYEQLYKQNPDQYLQKIWKHEKAKCDEANTMAIQALENMGVNADLISGHSVNSTTEDNEAVLAENNRHAWMEVWDKQNEEWVRMDATPSGDPDVDDEQQEQDLMEGDWPDQEQEFMSDEELEELKKELEQQEHSDEAREIAEETDTDIEDVEDLLEKFNADDLADLLDNYDPEQLDDLLEKIQALRERYSTQLKKLKSTWQQAVRKNFREDIEYTGPVRMSEGDYLDDPVEARIDTKSGEGDPMGWHKEQSEQKEAKVFGGWEIYINADLSKSMRNRVNGTKKVEAQRDMVFLLMESAAKAAIEVKKNINKLKQEMPVRLSLNVFGEETKIALPLTNNWGDKERMYVYDQLTNTGGSTPEHKALQLTNEQIEQSHEQELQEHDEDNMNRFTITVADGGSDNPGKVSRQVDKLQEKDIPVDLFLIANENDENLIEGMEDVYPSVSVVSDPSDLAEEAVDNLVERIKKAYNLKKGENSD